MFDFISTTQYAHCFDVAILILVLFAFFLCQRGIILNREVVNINAAWGFVLAVLIILYIGLRPISANFGDTMNYAQGFNNLSNTPFKWTWTGDFLFYNMMQWFSKFTTVHGFFLFCAFLYVGPLWLAMRRLFSSYYFIPFLVILCMFSFWQYGVNGIRNGIASSFFILALSYINRLPVAVLLCLIAIGFHKSMGIIIAAAALTWFVDNSYIYLFLWLISIPISYLFGNRIQVYLATFSFLGEGDERLSQYMLYSEQDMISEGAFVDMSFHWDYILYSLMAVSVGYYFIFRRNFKEEYYSWLYNTFLIANAFWILIIRAAYSNRFAQISWFIMPIVLIYPFMKKRFWINHEKMLGYALLAFYAFAFYYNIVKG